MDTTSTMFVLTAMLAATPAVGQGLTVVNEPWPGEASHAQMLADAFGGTFASTGVTAGLNFHSNSANSTTSMGFSNGSISAVRVEDRGMSLIPSLTNLASGDDDTFARGSYDAQALGGYSALQSEFGVIGSDGQFRTLLASNSDGSMSYHPSDTFDWGIRTSLGDLYTSNASDNNGNDHMVTYAVYDSSNSLIGAVLFFEDFGGESSDWDYNDFGILLTLAPAPQAALLGLTGLGGIGLAAGRRRR